VIIQDQATSVVWGMPKAVYEADAFDEICSLDICRAKFTKFAHGQ
jgi:chemotaxis response regulator CheB